MPTKLHQAICHSLLPLCFALTASAAEPPTARIAASSTVVEGRQPVELSAASSTDDLGIVSTRWQLPPITYAFDDGLPDPDWVFSTGVSQDGSVRATGTGSWYQRHFTATQSYGPGSAFEGRVRTPDSTSSYCMVGFKHPGSPPGFEPLRHAIYFRGGALQIYENGSRVASTGTYVRGEEYVFRIDRLATGGVRYSLRAVTEPDFLVLRESSVASEPALHPAAAIYSGPWSFDDISIERSIEGVEINTWLPASGRIRLEVRDGDAEVGTSELEVEVTRGAAPDAQLDAPNSVERGQDFQLSAERSSDDFAIRDYSWDLGDGGTARGRRILHRFEEAGLKSITLTITDYAGQRAVASKDVLVTEVGLVRTVPWRFERGAEVAHTAIPGVPLKLKAVASTATPPVQWTWDFGDGSATASGTATTAAQAREIEAIHVYGGEPGATFRSTITIVDANGAESSDVYSVVLRERSLRAETDIAIDDGLWYLHRHLVPEVDPDGPPSGRWSESGYTLGATSSALQAFAVFGHRPTGDAASDPYVDNVVRALNHLTSALRPRVINEQPHGDPDTNRNGIALDLDTRQPIYELGQVMDGILASSSPELAARTGLHGVVGRPHLELIRDCMDMYFWGQHDGAAGGGWRYSWNQAPDNSASQWAAIGCIPAQHSFGLSIPSWVKERNVEWLTYSDSAQGFGYTGPGAGHATTPAGMVQIAMNGISSDDPLWTRAEDSIAAIWSTFRNSRNLYAQYTLYKAMILARPKPLEVFRSSGLRWLDDPVEGLARHLIDDQAADGSWTSRAWISGRDLSTSWALIILSGTLVESSTVALEVELLPESAGVTSPPPGRHALEPGTKVHVNALARDGFGFLRWEGPVEEPQSARTSLTVDTDTLVRAVFEATPAVTIAGHVFERGVGAIENADVWLYGALTSKPLATTTTDADGDFVFGETLGLRGGWYRLIAAAGDRSGDTDEFWVSTRTFKDLEISASEALGLMGSVHEIARSLEGVARADQVMLADMSRHIDEFASTYHAAETVLQIANILWSAYEIYSGVSGGAEDIERLLRLSDTLTDYSRYILFARGILDFESATLGFFDLVQNTDQEGLGAFLRSHVSVSAGGDPFAGENHLATEAAYATDAVSRQRDSAIDAATNAFRATLSALDEGVDRRLLRRYLAQRAAVVARASERAELDSQLLLFLPESAGRAGGMSEIPLLLRPIYLQYFRTIVELEKLFGSRVAVLGLKVTTNALVAGGAISSFGLALVAGVAVNVVAGEIERHIEGVQLDLSAHLVELWGRAGHARVVDSLALPLYLESIRRFVATESDRPYYLANHFQSEIEDVELSFPESSFWNPDRSTVEVRASIRNGDRDGQTAILARHYARNDLGAVFDALPARLYPSWILRGERESLITEVLSDAEALISSGDLDAAESMETRFRLASPAGLLANLLDTQSVVLQVFTGPWETSFRIENYNLVPDVLEGAGDGAGHLFGHGAGRAQPAEFEAWRERVVQDERFSLSRESPTRETVYAVPEGVKVIRVCLREQQGTRVDLLVIDSTSGSRLGFLTEDGREVRELVGAYSGPHGEFETVSLSVVPGMNLTLRSSLATDGGNDEARAQLCVYATPVRPAVLGVSPRRVEMHRRPGERVDYALTLVEAGGQAPLTNLRVQLPTLSGEDANILPRRPRSADFPTLAARERAVVTASYDLPDDASGRLHGEVRVLAAEIEEQRVPVSLVVDGVDPDTALTVRPPTVADGNLVEFEWSGTDDQSPRDQLRYEILLEGVDSGWRDAFRSTRFEYRGLVPGDYIFQARSVDLAGNVDASPATHVFSVANYFVRGETNSSGEQDVTDAIVVVNFLFLGGEEPPCLDAADANDDGTLDLSDVVTILGFLFIGRNRPPPPPFPGCGADPTLDGLDCKSFPDC